MKESTIHKGGYDGLWVMPSVSLCELGDLEKYKNTMAFVSNIFHTDNDYVSSTNLLLEKMKLWNSCHWRVNGSKSNWKVKQLKDTFNVRTKNGTCLELFFFLFGCISGWKLFFPQTWIFIQMLHKRLISLEKTIAFSFSCLRLQDMLCRASFSCMITPSGGIPLGVRARNSETRLMFPRKKMLRQSVFLCVPSCEHNPFGGVRVSQAVTSGCCFVHLFLQSAK